VPAPYTPAMAMSARRCAGCGGPLPQTPPETRQITCTFCGIVNDLAHAGQQPVTINVDVGGAARAASKAGRIIVLVVFAGIAIALLATAFVLQRAFGPTGDVVKTVTDQARAVVKGGLAPADLATASELGWHTVNAPATATGFAQFDPVANLQWAMEIARAWAPDARLTRIDANKLSPAGVVDAKADATASAGYRFESPSRIEEWSKLADRDSTAKAQYELMLKITQGTVTALVGRGRPSSSREVPPATAHTQRLGTLIETAVKHGKGFVEYPFYNAYMIHLEQEGWVWYFQSLSQRASLPRVRARDGAVFPYRR
jgi:hypothetical protein